MAHPLTTNSTNPPSATVVGGVYNPTPPAPIAGQSLPFQQDSSGNLLVNVAVNGDVPLVPLFSTIAVSSSGATTIVAATVNKIIRVIAVWLVSSAAANIKWQSHVLPTDITGLAYCAANGGYVLPYNPIGWFQTISGEALDINLSAAVAVGGSITYVKV